MGQTVYTALGLMSGTSLDGVDAAFLETDGERIIRFGPSLTTAFKLEDCETLTNATRAALRWQFDGARPNSFSVSEDVIHETHLSAISDICAVHPDWAERLDMIGFHGQTVLHLPPSSVKKGQTLQLGDGQRLADAAGVPVYFDFRSADVAAGGQGAPLAPIYHRALAAYSSLNLPTAVLNIGGVSNVTLLGESNILATDCGPGNGPLDNWTMFKLDRPYDANGQMSLSGDPDFGQVDKWLEIPFFKKNAPKSADRYDFDVIKDIHNKSVEDGAATLSAFTALSVEKSLSTYGTHPHDIVVCGGGRQNKAMLWMMRQHLSAHVKTAEQAGWNGDAIEAEAFAYLAVRAKLGLPISFPGTTGVPKPMTGGRVALPR